MHPFYKRWLLNTLIVLIPLLVFAMPMSGEVNEGPIVVFFLCIIVALLYGVFNALMRLIFLKLRLPINLFTLFLCTFIVNIIPIGILLELNFGSPLLVFIIFYSLLSVCFSLFIKEKPKGDSHD